MVDVGLYLTRARNVITVVGFGRPGHSALVLVSDDIADDAGAQGGPGASVALPRIAWDSGSLSPESNLRWGG